MKTSQKNPLNTSDFAIVTCYNCQVKFFQMVAEIKSLNFCATCWSK